VTVLARRLAAGEASAAETAADWLDRLRRVHEMTNCVAAWNDDAALRTARDLDERIRRDGPVGPLHGVPFTVKDWIEAEGLPCTGGLRRFADRMPARDATVVARLRAAGAVLLAKTTVQPDSRLFGPVRNPHDARRSPGGSSSGEGAAVGGGGSPFGLGSDSGGSVRLPAAWCGTAGLKPSAGRVPLTGHFPAVFDRADGRTQIGPLAASVEDLALVLDVIAGPDGRDPACVPYAPELARTTLRVGWNCGEGEWQPAPHVRTAVETARDTLAGAGAELVGEIPHSFDDALDITRRYWRRRELTGREADQQLVDWDQYRVRMLRNDSYDVAVLPATADNAPLHREMEETDYVYMLPASLTGWPVVVVPVAQHDGLPVAVQVVARPRRDDLALHAAQLLQGSA
jgi:amidase